MRMSAPFRVGYCPIRQVMDSLCLSAAGVRFLRCPSPTEGLALLHSRVTALADLIGVVLFRIREIRTG